MVHSLRYLSLFVCALLIVACKKDSMESRIDSDVKISMWEYSDSTGRKLELKCETDKSYGCCNYTILHSLSVSGSNIEINFTGIYQPDMCLTSFGPATTSVDLSSLPNGSYPLTIRVERRKSQGNLIVTSDYYEIDLDETRSVEIITPVLRRIPANTIWGTVGYHSNATSMLVQSFVDSLQFYGAAIQPNAPGYYGYFDIDANNAILPPDNHGYYFIRPFIFSYSGNSHSIKTLVRNYGLNFGDSLNIDLRSTQGHHFMSWVQ